MRNLVHHDLYWPGMERMRYFYIFWDSFWEKYNHEPDVLKDFTGSVASEIDHEQEFREEAEEGTSKEIRAKRNVKEAAFL